MLRIRLTRTGKKGQPSYRVVVAEKSKAVKRKYLELLGHYLPAVQPKKVELNKERIEYWISKGAQPTDTAAALFKSQGMDGMEKFMEPRNKKKKKKGEQPEEEAAPAAAPAPAASADAPAAAPTEEAKSEEPAKEEAPAEEPKAEEKPAEEEAKEDAPAA
ncbi:30S ribosomal protein S16 [Candidatus Peregrinibacteria bacterium]|nr:30S ribosomal protein S16 [Candidatus Peregrinibacteria bacterium]